MNENKRVLTPIADGVEEMEAVTIIDVLRRAGAHVTVASVTGLTVAASRGVKLTADCLIDSVVGETFDLIVLPGGLKGAEHLRDSGALTDMLKKHIAEGRLFAAICSAPAMVLAYHGLLGQRRAVCYPGTEIHANPREWAADDVLADNGCITGRGAGVALPFALKLVEILFNAAAARHVAEKMLAPLNQ